VLALAINVGFLIFFNIQWYMQKNKVNYTPDYSEYTSWLGFIEFIMFVLLMVWLWCHHHD
jgi:cytosine/uracil/thiamine/allantoin permease